MVYPSLLEQLSASLGDAFQFERELGGGGMSRVFLAEDRQLGRHVVVKVLPPEFTTELSADRFRREMLIAARLQHPNIVPLFTAGQAANLMYYAMPFVAGDTLRVRLSREAESGAAPGLPIDEVVRILHDVARAMRYAHRHGIVHRDIKPENILLSDDGALVTDFGVAKAMYDAAQPGGARSLTADGRAIGTADYMAPEQAVGDPKTDHRADIYAAGVVAYEMLTGVVPFTGRTVNEVLAAHAVSEPTPIGQRRPGVPPPLVALIARCLAKRADDRPSSADEVIRALDSIASGGRSSWRRAVRSPRVWAWAAGVMVVMGLGTASSIKLASMSDDQRAILDDKLAILATILRRPPPSLRPHRYFVATFANHTGDAQYDQWGFLIASSIERALTLVPNIEVADATTRQANEELVKQLPWLWSAARQNRAAAREASAGMLIGGSLFRDGDTVRIQTSMTDLATGALVPPIQDVVGPALRLDTIVARLTGRIVGAIWHTSDTGVVARMGAFSDASSLAAYDALRRGMKAYFLHDTSMYALLRRAEELDSTWVTPTIFLAYIDAWSQRAAEFERDRARAERLTARMTPAEQGLLAYVQALALDDLRAILPAAIEFKRNTPGSMESPLLVSSTALGLRQAGVADSALRDTDPDRGLNLVGPYYWQSRVGLAQALGDGRAVLDAARQGERRFPHWILFRAYEARELVRERRLAQVDHVIDAAQMQDFPREAARVVVAAQAASELAMEGRDADAEQISRNRWGATLAFRNDTALWVQEAVANLALVGGRWADLAAMERPGTLTSAHALADRVSFVAVGRIHMGDTTGAMRCDSLLAADHPPLDFGYRELARARIAAHLGQRDRAMQLLRQSADEGVRLHLLWGFGFTIDPFLAPMRSYPPFLQLVAHTER